MPASGLVPHPRSIVSFSVSLIRPTSPSVSDYLSPSTPHLILALSASLSSSLSLPSLLSHSHSLHLFLTTGRCQAQRSSPLSRPLFSFYTLSVHIFRRCERCARSPSPLDPTQTATLGRPTASQPATPLNRNSGVGTGTLSSRLTRNE